MKRIIALLPLLVIAQISFGQQTMKDLLKEFSTRGYVVENDVNGSSNATFNMRVLKIPSVTGIEKMTVISFKPGDTGAYDDLMQAVRALNDPTYTLAMALSQDHHNVVNRTWVYTRTENEYIQDIVFINDVRFGGAARITASIAHYQGKIKQTDFEKLVKENSPKQYTMNSLLEEFTARGDTMRISYANRKSPSIGMSFGKVHFPTLVGIEELTGITLKSEDAVADLMTAVSTLDDPEYTLAFEQTETDGEKYTRRCDRIFIRTEGEYITDMVIICDMEPTEGDNPRRASILHHQGKMKQADLEKLVKKNSPKQYTMNSLLEEFESRGSVARFSHPSTSVISMTWPMLSLRSIAGIEEVTAITFKPEDTMVRGDLLKAVSTLDDPEYTLATEIIETDGEKYTRRCDRIFIRTEGEYITDLVLICDREPKEGDNPKLSILYHQGKIKQQEFQKLLNEIPDGSGGI